jgi:hypothetical protein
LTNSTSYEKNLNNLVVTTGIAYVLETAIRLAKNPDMREARRRCVIFGALSLEMRMARQGVLAMLGQQDDPSDDALIDDNIAAFENLREYFGGAVCDRIVNSEAILEAFGAMAELDASREHQSLVAEVLNLMALGFGERIARNGGKEFQILYPTIKGGSA